MNRTPVKRRAHAASTITMDMSIRYPCPFTCMSLSPYGRDLALAGRQGLAIIDLEFPHSPPRTIPIRSAKHPADVVWCPSMAKHSWVGTAVNQTLMIYDLAHKTNKAMRSLKCHAMAITDVAWASHAPSWIGTTSYEPMIKIWDVQRDQKPVWCYSRWEGAELLRFHSVRAHKLATVHRNKFCVWDIRYGSAPLAIVYDDHNQLINSITWHPFDDDVLVTATQDNMIKKWNIRGESNPEYTHVFLHDVLNVDYTPFGEGLLVKQDLEDDNVLLIRDQPQYQPVYKFTGHKGAVLASEWRTRGEISRSDGVDTREFQLLTWGQDEVLRMWAVDDRIIESVGGEPTRDANRARDYSNVAPSFATNFLGMDQVLQMFKQKTLPGEVLLAASRKPDMGDITTIHEFNRAGNMLGNSRALHKPDESDDAAKPPSRQTAHSISSKIDQSVGRKDHDDDRSSDDDDDDDGDGEYNAPQSIRSWKEEINTIAIDKYKSSGTVELNRVLDDARRCILNIGVPWITEDAIRVRIDFPVDYPHSALHASIERAGIVYGSRDAIQNEVASIADRCAEQGILALDTCLYALICILIKTLRSRNTHGKQTQLRKEDHERLPLPPPSMQHQYLTDDGEERTHAQKRQGTGMQNRHKPTLHTNPRDKRKSMGDALSSNNDDQWQPNSFNSEEDKNSVQSNYNDEYEHSDDNDGRDYSDDDNDDYEEEYYSHTHYGADGLYLSDTSPPGIGGGLEDLSIPLQRGSIRDQYNRNTPFPRLCGGVFSGPGQLICFFSSMYTPDTYPEQSRSDQPGLSAHEKTRQDMSQQLRTLFKPRTLTELQRYQSLVHFGLQNKDIYLKYGGKRSKAANGGSSSELGASDGEEAREEIPLYYFPQQASRATESIPGSDASDRKTYFKPPGESKVEHGVGNMALICSVPQDRSANYELARAFVLAGPSTEWICKHNANVASLHDQQELANVWSLLGCLVGPVTPESQTGSLHSIPANRAGMWSSRASLLLWFRSVMAKYERKGDAQMLAMLACVLSRSMAEYSAALTAANNAESHVKSSAAAAAAAAACVPTGESALSATALPPWMRSAGDTSSRCQTLNIAAFPDTKGGNMPFTAVGSSSALIGSMTNQWASPSHAEFGLLMQDGGPRSVSFVSHSLQDERGALLSTHLQNVPTGSTWASIQNYQIDSGAATTNALISQSEGRSFTHTPPSFVMNGTPLAVMQKLKTFNADRIKSVNECRISAGSVAQYLSVQTSPYPYPLESLPLLSKKSSMPPPPAPLMISDSVLPEPDHEPEPLSPEILEELDSEEIKQHELMMTEGLDSTPDSSFDSQPPKRESSIQPATRTSGATTVSEEDVSKSDSEYQLAGNRNSASDGKQGSSKPNSGGAPRQLEGTEKLWHRIRDNVLGRPQTYQADGGSGKASTTRDTVRMAMGTSASEHELKEREQSTQNSSSLPGLAATKRHPGSATPDADSLNKCRTGMQPKSGLVRPWDPVHMWMPLVSSRSAAQDKAKEMAYLQTKREFERPHTVLRINDRSEWEDQSPMVSPDDYRCSPSYLDHWKFVYARILYMWRMDEKAIEVLKCVQDPFLREFYNEMYSQQTIPKHDNILRVGNPILARQAQRKREKLTRKSSADAGSSPREPAEHKDAMADEKAEAADQQNSSVGEKEAVELQSEISGAPWLSCSYCHEYVHGRALICRACGHGGHQKHMLRWYRAVRKHLVQSGLSSAQKLGLSIANSTSSSIVNLRHGANMLSNNSLSGMHSSVASGGGTRNNTQANTRIHTRNPTMAAPHGESLVDMQLNMLSEVMASPLSNSGDSSGNKEGISNAGADNDVVPESPDVMHMAIDRNDGLERDSRKDATDTGSDANTDLFALWDEGNEETCSNCSSSNSLPERTMLADASWQSSDDEYDDYARKQADRIYNYGSDVGGSSEDERLARQMAMQASEYAGPSVPEHLDIPTCPSGCGCNCLFESKKLMFYSN